MKLIAHILIFILLTILTQIGGIIYLLAMLFVKRKKKQYRLKRAVIFLGLYLIATYFITPWIAPIFGRQKIDNNQAIDSHFFVTGLCNRNYVSTRTHAVLQQVASQFHQQYPDTKLIYLDANFPFLDGFPLLPHLSHNDGKKVDLAFFYKDQNGKPTDKKPSTSGYGMFENPKKGEINQTNICKSQGSWHYDYPKFLTFGSNNQLTVNSKRTKRLIQLISRNPNVQKIFIEPHLKQRWNLNSNKIRFHGCQAVRHDDHIHIQFR